MRDIKFRGISIKNNSWVIGDLHKNIDFTKAHIHPIGEKLFSVDVKPETIGQYTGLKDKNGNEIYEGDILKSEFTSKKNISKWEEVECEGYSMIEIGFNNGSFVTRIIEQKNAYYGEIPSRWESVYFKHISEYYEIVGNIYEGEKNV